jgi:hypothetical protein
LLGGNVSDFHPRCAWFEPRPENRQLLFKFFVVFVRLSMRCRHSTLKCSTTPFFYIPSNSSFVTLPIISQCMLSCTESVVSRE